jgi:hypothetical protein
MSDILYSKLRLKVPQELDGESATITSSKGISRNVTMSSPITDIMLAGMEKYTVQAGTANESLAFGYGQIKKIQATFLPDSLENATWQMISYTIKNGTFSQYASVGDTKSFVLNGKTYHAEVVAINDGTGSAGSWYPDKTVDFICKELYETKYPYNSINTNTGGFPSSELRNTLVNTLYPLLPTDLKDVIIAKSHSYITSTSGTMANDSTNLWLPTHYEIAGTTDTYAPGETSLNNKKYTLASLIKTLNGQPSAVFWWLGSMRSDNSTHFWVVSASGTNFSRDNAFNPNGVPLGFRIG